MRYGEWRDRGCVSNRAPTPPNDEPAVSASDHVEPIRDALFSPVPSPAFAPPRTDALAGRSQRSRTHGHDRACPSLACS
eukprot:5094230-Prymnesium_polylepis.1